jgi:NADH-quinone oxidoreductase subunit N
MLDNYAIVIAQSILAAGLCVILLAGLWAKDAYSTSYKMSTALLLLLAVFMFFVMPGKSHTVMSGLIIQDHLSWLLSVVLLLTGAYVLFLSNQGVRDCKLPAVEYYCLFLSVLLGAWLLIVAHNLLLLYLGLEMMSLPVYAMIALERKNKLAAEASVKYFIQGAVASGFLLYGISLVYGFAGSLDYSSIIQLVTSSNAGNSGLLLLGMVFMLVGIVFKLGAAPMHLWVPDVYAASPMPALMLVTSIPKIAAFALTFRLLVQVIPLHSGAHAVLPYAWSAILVSVAVISMGFGNIVALVQTNIRKLLAYSSIGHMGFLLLGLLTGLERGYEASLFYTLSYVLMTLAAFGVLAQLEANGNNIVDITDLRGLSSRAPVLAAILMILMFSMAGIPPLLGFMAKLSVLEALVAQHMTALAVLAIVFSVIGAFYYLRVIKEMYFQSADGEKLVYQRAQAGVMQLNAALIVLLGMMPGVLFAICKFALGS